MTMKLALCTGFLVFAASAHAQIIEIGATGEAQTFDGPTTFTSEGATSLRDNKSLKSAAADSMDLFKQAAQRHNLDPALLKAVAWQESNGRMDAVSTKGARGIMQLMPNTAAQLGVDPGDTADNIRGGALYLRQQLDRFGSVPLALAAYNAGPGAVIRFGGVPPYRETQGYVARIMQRWHPAAATVTSTVPRSAAAAVPPAKSFIIEVPHL